MKDNVFRVLGVAALAVVAASATALGADDRSAYEVDWWEVIKKSPTLWVLVLCSSVMLAFFIERVLTYRTFRGDPEALMTSLVGACEGGDVASAVQAARTQDVPLARVLRHGLEAWPVTKAGLQERFDVGRIREKSLMEKRLSFFATMSTTGPFIGLFGTVLGIVDAFHSLAVTGAGGKEKLMAGISEALVATAAGIFVGVLSAIFFNHFTVKQKRLLAQIDVYAKEMVVLLFEKLPGRGSGRESAGKAAEPAVARR